MLNKVPEAEEEATSAEGEEPAAELCDVVATTTAEEKIPSATVHQPAKHRPFASNLPGWTGPARRPPTPALRDEGRLPVTCPDCGGPALQEPNLLVARGDGTTEERPGPVRCPCQSPVRACRFCKKAFRPARTERTCPDCLPAPAEIVDTEDPRR